MAKAVLLKCSWRLKGDGALITDRLVRGIGQQGGRVVCGAEVVELVEKCGRLSAAVCRDGEDCLGRGSCKDLRSHAGGYAVILNMRMWRLSAETMESPIRMYIRKCWTGMRDCYGGL